MKPRQTRGLASPELRYLYSGRCLLCALAGDTGVDAGISGYNGVNFLLTGGILRAVFYSAQEKLRNPFGTC